MNPFQPMAFGMRALSERAEKAEAERDAMFSKVEQLKAATVSLAVSHSDAVHDLKVERDELRAEVERLRGLVREAYDEGWQAAPLTDEVYTNGYWLDSRARAALEPQKKDLKT